MPPPSEDSPLEEALRTLLGQEPLVQSLGDALPAGIFVADAQGRFIYSNPRLQAMGGPIPEQPASQAWGAGVHPDDRARVRANG